MKTAYQNLALYWLIALVAMSGPVEAQYRVIGYYPMWTRATLPASAVRFDVLTHINHAFAWPNTDGSIASYETTADTALINSTHRAGRKILLSFGGAGSTQTTNFALVTADSALRMTFVNNIVSRLSTYHYDGADLDWEGPVSLAEKLNESIFVQELHSAFRAVDTTWLITMAIGASDWSGQWHDYSTLKLYVNWFNSMEYDFHGSWSALAGHNAPLYVGTDPNSDPDRYSIDQSVQYLTSTRSIPKQQVVLGLPFYGKSFGTSTLYTSYTGEQDLAYRDILNTVRSGNWTYTWDSGSKAPYYTSTSPPKLLTFDDSASIATKCQYVRNQGLSGVMIWEISQDVVGPTQPLLDVVGAQMIPTTVVIGRPLELQPASYLLSENYPNPFNPSTTIQYAVPTANNVLIRVFDILGRQIATLVNEYRGPGVGTVRFDASKYGISSGVYFYRIQSGGFTETKKMILAK